MSMRRNLLIGLAVLVALVAAVAAISTGKASKRADAPQVSAIEPTEQGSGEAGGKVATSTAKDIDGLARRRINLTQGATR